MTPQPQPTPAAAPAVDPAAADPTKAELTRADLWGIANDDEAPKQQRMRALRAIELLDQLTLWQRREALNATRAALKD